MAGWREPVVDPMGSLARASCVVALELLKEAWSMLDDRELEEEERMMSDLPCFLPLNRF